MACQRRRAQPLAPFEEKPTVTYLVSMGIYFASRAVFDHVPAGQKYRFDDLMLDLLARGDDVHVERYAGYWLDIGRVDDYMRAIEDFEERKRDLLHDAG